MSDMNFEQLKENVTKLMKEKGLTQKALAEQLGMSQPNLNKCLIPSTSKGSRNFTLEQVCKLSDFFSMSVDDLLGRSTQRSSFSELEICQFLSTLISHNQITHFDYPVPETHCFPVTDPEGDWYHDEKIEVKYNAFYFPNYVHIPSYIDDDDPRYDEVRDDIMYGGNEHTHNMAINNFLDRFIETYEKYDGGKLSEEDYKILEDAYYKVLKKNQKRR